MIIKYTQDNYGDLLEGNCLCVLSLIRPVVIFLFGKILLQR